MRIFNTLLLFLSLTASAQSHFNISLAWDPAPDTNVTAYRLYTGIVANTYTNNVLTTNTTTTVSNLTSGVVYHFALTAQTFFGVESIPTPEITYFVRPIAPSGLRTNGVFLTVQSKQTLFDFEWADTDLTWPLSTDKNSNSLAFYQLKIATTKD